MLPHHTLMICKRPLGRSDCVALKPRGQRRIIVHVDLRHAQGPRILARDLVEQMSSSSSEPICGRTSFGAESRDSRRAVRGLGAHCPIKPVPSTHSKRRRAKEEFQPFHPISTRAETICGRIINLCFLLESLPPPFYTEDSELSTKLTL